jgi:hypothetical protein
MAKRQVHRSAMAGAALAASVMLGAPAVSHATALGYGELEGTWDLNHPSTFANPSASNVTQWGNYILAVEPTEFDINQFHLAGATGAWSGTVTDGALTFTATNANAGTWIYNGGVNNNQPVDLFLAMKYGNFVSVFEYDHVAVGDSGTITDDPKVYFGLGSEPGQCDLSQGYFNANCMELNRPGNGPLGISHVVGYWPPDGNPLVPTGVDIPVPEPVSLGLLGFGVLGLAWSRRRLIA